MQPSGDCRLCGQPCRLRVSLAPTPLANSFPSYPDVHAERYPLQLDQCLSCDHIQSRRTAPVSWEDYRYATPAALRPHLEQAARDLRARYPRANAVLEIGSNNGLYLDVLTELGFEALGVDPCATVGIRAPFTAELARTLDQPDLIVANNVLAHVDDLQDCFRGIDALLGEQGSLIFEVQYWPALVEAGAFDMIYHEHRDYHTLGPLVPFLKQYGLVMDRVDHLDTHGGSIRVYCERPGIQRWVYPDERTDWRAFMTRMEETRQLLQAEVEDSPGPLVAFGATAKACTLIHQCHLADRIAYCVDDTPAKQGRYVPGTAIPILSPAVLREHPEATILLTAWNFASVIRQRYPHHRFLVPFTREVV